MLFTGPTDCVQCNTVYAGFQRRADTICRGACCGVLVVVDSLRTPDWNSPRKTDGQLRVFVAFELRWGDIPQRTVSPLAVVEHFDVL